MSALWERLAFRLFAKGEASIFLQALAAGKSGRPVALFPTGHAVNRENIPEWTPPWVGQPEPGCAAAYPLDLSSVWEAMALTEAGPVRALLDLCAAPGGKSLFAARWFPAATRLANEVTPKRLGPLRHNLARCGVSGFTQRKEAAWWAEQTPECFDLVLVDAPCSGQSLVARGIENRGCFHPSVTAGNAKRQRGILARAAECVASGGSLVYMTCTFSLEENERVLAWFLKRHPAWRACHVGVLADWQSPHLDAPCYRLGPHQGLGAGGFTCLLRRDGPVPARLRELPAEALAWPVAAGADPV